MEKRVKIQCNIMRRKLFLLGLFQCFGIFIYHYYGILLSILVILIYIISSRVNYIKLAYDEFLYGKLAFLVIIFYLIGIMSSACFDVEYFNDAKSIPIGQRERISCVVDDCSFTKNNRLKLQVRVTSTKNSSIRETTKGIIIISDKDKKCSVGDKIDLDINFSIPEPACNPRGFDYREYLKSKNIVFTGYGDRIENKGSSDNLLDLVNKKAYKIRGSIEKDISYSHDISPLVMAILFGEKDELNKEYYDDFKVNGTAHILAVSGLHIGVIFLVFKKIYREFPSGILAVVFLSILIFYGFLAQWTPSVTRAIIVCLIGLLGEYLDRNVDFITSISVASIVTLIINPYQFFSPSYQMSFLAAISIGILGEFFSRWMGKGIATALSVQMGMIPYMSYVFNYISLGGFIFNIPTLFLMVILVPLGLLLSLINCFDIEIPYINNFIWGLGYMIVKVNELDLGRFSPFIEVASPPLYIITIITIMSLILPSEAFYVALLRKNIKALLLLMATIIVITGITYPISNTIVDKGRVIMLDVGQGDGIHIKTSDGKNFLFDGGGNRNFNLGEKTLKPYFLKNGISHIDGGYITHWDMDHSLGVTQLSEIYEIRSFSDNRCKGDSIKGKDYRLDWLWPINREYVGVNNDNSSVCKVTVDGLSVLITGDISEEQEKQLIELYKGTDILKCDVLKVSHHGSRYGTCKEFINVVNPKVAIIGVGKNHYGHPNEGVIDSLEEKGVKIFRTDINGAISIAKVNGEIRCWPMYSEGKYVIKGLNLDM